MFNEPVYEFHTMGFREINDESEAELLKSELVRLGATIKRFEYDKNRKYFSTILKILSIDQLLYDIRKDTEFGDGICNVYQVS